MTPAVFLDRDGTVIQERGYLDRLELVELFPWSAEAIRLLKDAGYAVVIVTNQAGIARGYFDEAFVQAAHVHLDALLRARGAVVDGYYYCPHHPDGAVERYRLACDCRKPAPGLVRRAAADLGLDIGRSFVVGDKWLDVGLAVNAGARGILVRTGYGGRDVPVAPPGYDCAVTVDTLLDAARWILADATALADALSRPRTG
jgi:D-glycero-D-manno-heptose 1,7-bisphosphate phosphatase